MSFRGVYEDGVVRPTEPVPLANGTEVEFQPLDARLAEIERSSRNFFAKRSLEELVQESGARPMTSFDELTVDWPEDDDIEEFLRQVRRGRA